MRALKRDARTGRQHTTRTIRALLGLVATLALLFTMAGGGGTAPSVNRG